MLKIDEVASRKGWTIEKKTRNVKIISANFGIPICLLFYLLAMDMNTTQSACLMVLLFMVISQNLRNMKKLPNPLLNLSKRLSAVKLIYSFSSGGGELFGVDTNGNYFAVPSVSMSDEDKIDLGNTFVKFIQNLDAYLD